MRSLSIGNRKYRLHGRYGRTGLGGCNVAELGSSPLNLLLKTRLIVAVIVDDDDLNDSGTSSIDDRQRYDGSIG